MCKSLLWEDEHMLVLTNLLFIDSFVLFIHTMQSFKQYLLQMLFNIENLILLLMVAFERKQSLWFPRTKFEGRVTITPIINYYKNLHGKKSYSCS